MKFSVPRYRRPEDIDIMSTRRVVYDDTSVLTKSLRKKIKQGGN